MISLEMLSTVTDIGFLNAELIRALDHHDPARVKTVLGRGANPNFEAPGRLETPLIIACYNGDAESVLHLLSFGADPNMTMMSDDKRVITPLMIAAETGLTEAVAELLKYNADPHVRTAMGETALLAAARSNNHDAFAVLVGSMVRGSTPPLDNKVVI